MLMWQLRATDPEKAELEDDELLLPYEKRVKRQNQYNFKNVDGDGEFMNSDESFGDTDSFDRMERKAPRLRNRSRGKKRSSDRRKDKYDLSDEDELGRRKRHRSKKKQLNEWSDEDEFGDRKEAGLKRYSKNKKQHDEWSNEEDGGHKEPGLKRYSNKKNQHDEWSEESEIGGRK